MALPLPFIIPSLSQNSLTLYGRTAAAFIFFSIAVSSAAARMRSAALPLWHFSISILLLTEKI
jgi:hypothetical protein